MWSLAFGFEPDSAKARAMEKRYCKARAYDGNPESAALLAAWLIQNMRRVLDGEFMHRWASDLVHELVDVIEKTAPPGTTVRNEKANIHFVTPNTLRLPCRDCGYVFESSFRAGGYRRTCSGPRACFEYEPKVPDHPRGGLVQYKRGDYPKHRRGQTLGVAEYGQSVVCIHPDCLELFLVAGHNRDYCDEHLGKREEASRLRRSRPPRCERWAFSLAPGVEHATYCWGPLAEVTQVGIEGRYARDEDELQTLVQLAATGALVVTDTLSTN